MLHYRVSNAARWLEGFGFVASGLNPSSFSRRDCVGLGGLGLRLSGVMQGLRMPIYTNRYIYHKRAGICICRLLHL